MAERDRLIVGKADGVIPAYEACDKLPESNFTVSGPSIAPGLYPHWGILHVTGVGERFLLTDRSFTGKPFADGGIDQFFGRLPSIIIKNLQKLRAKKEVDIVDIGGGKSSASAREIIEIFPLTRVVNVDLILEEERSEGRLTEKPGSVLSLPLSSDCADLVYSHQVLPYIKEKGRVDKALNEVVRILRPGGIALIDDGHYSLENDPTMIRSLERALASNIIVADKSYGGKFLALFKPPINRDLIKTGF